MENPQAGSRIPGVSNSNSSSRVVVGQSRRRAEPKLEVPLWGVDEVVSWVTKSGFQDYGPAFRECGVDGDMLLQLTDIEIKDDIGIKNGILRKRFIRELKELKKTAG